MHTYLYMHTHTYIHTCLLLLISMLWHRQTIFESKGDKLSSSAECRIRTHQGLRHQMASRLNARWQTDSIYMKVNQYIYIYTLVYICIYILFLSVSHSHPHPPPPSFLSCWMHTSPVFMRNPSVDYNSAEQALKRGSSGFMSVEK